MLNRWYKSKTIVFALIVAVLSVLQGFVFAIPVEPKFQALIGVILSIVVTLLRIATKEPLSDK